MFLTRGREVGARLRRVRLLLAFGLIVSFASLPAPASAQAIPEDLREVLNRLYGDDFVETVLADNAADPEGDAITYGGDARPDEPGIVGAGWARVDGPIDPDELEEVCAESEPAGPGSRAICPEDFALLLGSTDYVLVFALLGAGFELVKFTQFTFLWAEEGLEVYQGAAGDPNNDETDSFDLFDVNGVLALGRTLYRDGTFDFAPSAAGLALLGPRFVAMLIPADQFLSTCLNVAVALITQGGVVDKAPLPDTANAAFAPAPAEPPPPPPPPPPPENPPATPPPPEATPPPPDAPTPPATQGPDQTPPDEPAAAPTPEPAPQAPAPAAAGDDGGGGGTLVIPLIGGVVVVLVGGWYLYSYRRRRKGDCEEEHRAVAAAEAGVAAARARRARAEAAADQARAGHQPATAVEPVAPSRTEFDDGPEGDRSFAGAREAFAAAHAQWQQATDAADATFAALEQAEAEEQAAVLAAEAAITTLFEATAALNACLGKPPPSPPSPEPAGPSSGGGRQTGPTVTRPGAEPTGGGRPAETGEPGEPGDEGGSGEGGDNEPEAVPAPAPEDGCRKGDTKDVVEKTQVYVIPNGSVTIDVPPTAAWRQFVVGSGGRMETGTASFDVDGFEALDEDDVSVGLSQLVETRGARRITAFVRVPVLVVTMTCLRVHECDGERYVPTGETKVKRNDSDDVRTWRINPRPQAGDEIDMSTPLGVIRAAQEEIEGMATPNAPAGFACP